MAALKIIDCDSSGIILEDKSTVPWEDIETIGKCVYPGRQLPWEFFYLRRRSNSVNYRIPTLRRFSFLMDEEKDAKERRLRRRVLEHAMNIPGIDFVVKTTHFGKEHRWDVQQEVQNAKYADSAEANIARKTYQKNFKIVTAILLTILLILILLRIFL